ncbi:hypothetical protein [Mycobacterium sp.]
MTTWNVDGRKDRASALVSSPSRAGSDRLESEATVGRLSETQVAATLGGL